MPEASQIIHLRERRRNHPKAGLIIGLGGSTLISLTVVSLILFSAIVYITLITDLPSPDLLINLMDEEQGLLNNPTQLLDRSGEYVVATLRHPATLNAKYLHIPDDLFEVDRPALPSTSEEDPLIFSRELILSTIATADPTFWQHAGFSLASINQDNHPTLAQQLASDLLLWDEPAGLRKALRERFLAAQITRQFGRAQILEWYLNSVQYGRLIYGADAAAQAYFGKSASSLYLSEAAWLAAAAQSPSLPPTLEEYEQVIQSMLTSGWIGQAEADQAHTYGSSPSLSMDAYTTYTSMAPGFSDYVLERLSQSSNLERIQRGGLKITTSLNASLQLQAACATYAHLERSGTAVEASFLPKDLDCQAERLLPTLSGATGSPQGELAANVIILDPTNGQILAYVDDPNSNLDPASIPGHPPGSLLTPFIYLTSFTRGFTPGSLVWDISSEDVLVTIDKLDELDHGPMRLRIALANDYLAPATQIMNRIGFDNILRTLRQLGLYSSSDEFGASPDNLDQSILLESGEVTLLRVVQAMGVLANQGVISGIPTQDPKTIGEPLGIVEPIVVLDIQDIGHRSWTTPPTIRNQPILSSQLAYLITNILSDESARWSTLGHPNALEIGRPAAAKLGRTGAGQDVWTVGYTPQMVIGVWIGRISPENAPPLSTQLPAALWHALMQNAHREYPSQSWVEPSGITTLEVCDPSGLLPSPNCPAVVSEIFLSGTEPIQVDNLYHAVQINRETGLLATIYTPSELVEDKVYLQVPPEAISWARQAGIPTPPDSYDLVTSITQNDPNTMISSPAMFSVVGGNVSIYGTADGDDFKGYRIQIGQGLNPTAWFQIGEDMLNPAQDAELAIWDTRGLSGLFTLQLLVEHKNQKVTASTVQVTIDNQAPEVSIQYPQAGQVIDLPSMTLQVVAQDDLRLAEVRFILDERLISRLEHSPYTVVWQTQPGDHILRVEASDQAGNITSASLSFTIK